MKQITLLSLLAVVLLAFTTACEKQDRKPLEALAGEYRLERRTGGFTGIDTTFAADSPPTLLSLTMEGNFSAQPGPNHGSFSSFSVPYEATLVSGEPEDGVYRISFPDNENLEGTDRYTGRAVLEGDRLSFSDPNLADGFIDTYVRTQ